MAPNEAPAVPAGPRGAGARGIGILLLLLWPVSLLALYGCLHNAQHGFSDDASFFGALMLPFAAMSAWLVWFGVVLVRKLPPSRALRIPGGIALLALVVGLPLNLYRMGGYPEDRQLAFVYLAPLLAVGTAGIGNWLDDGTEKPARLFYVLAPIAFAVCLGGAFLAYQTRGY